MPLASEVFDYEALLEEIGNSSLEGDRKEELLAALEETGGERAAIERLLERLHPGLALE